MYLNLLLLHMKMFLLHLVQCFEQLFYNALDKTKVLHLRGLDKDAYYRCSLDGKTYNGAVLENVGLRIDELLAGTGRAFCIMFAKINRR